MTAEPIEDDSGRQLRLIAEIVRETAAAGIEVWLRGGWAMDFFLGERTRPHVDVDWYCWAADADRLGRLLDELGYRVDPRMPVELQRDVLKDGVELSFAYLARDADGGVLVGAGPWVGTPLPADLLDGSVGRLAGTSCPIIGPRAQIEFKEMFPVWMPDRPRRPKDRDNLARLRAATGGSND